MPLQGNFTDMPLADLMQILTLQNKHGILTIEHATDEAQICFAGTRLQSAWVLHHRGLSSQAQVYTEGEAALHELLNWPEGEFTFELANRLPMAQNIWNSWDYLLLEHYRQQDEQERMDTADLRPSLVPNPPSQAEIRLDLEEWQVLLQVDGQHSIREIAAIIRHDLAAVQAVIQRLVEGGLVTLDKAEPVVELPPIAGNFGEITPFVYETGYINRTSGYYDHNNQPVYMESQSYRWEGTNTTNIVHYNNGPTANPVVEASSVNPNLAEPPAPPALMPGIAIEKPKTQRGFLSSLMAKIRGL